MQEEQYLFEDERVETNYMAIREIWITPFQA